MCDPVLNLVSEQVANGTLQSNCDLLFFTPALCYKVVWCCLVGLELFVYDRLKPDFGWQYVARGTVAPIADTLNVNGPFLPLASISEFWPVFPDQ